MGTVGVGIGDGVGVEDGYGVSEGVGVGATVGVGVGEPKPIIQSLLIYHAACAHGMYTNKMSNAANNTVSRGMVSTY